MNALEVHAGERAVGRLEAEHGRLTFTYLETPDARAISVRLPLRAEPYGDEECHAFFANLLPEGGWRDALCRQLSLAPSDDFALLSALGADCAGALTFHEPGSAADEPSAYVPIAEGELKRWGQDALSRPSLAKAAGLRLALAGAQDKLVIHLAEGQAYLCEHGAPSTVILKPDILGGFNGVELSALNELFCMQLAKQLGIPVATTRWFAGAVAVTRFDRVFVGSQLRRLHQEDFAQGLGLPHSAKYDVTWRDCFDLLARHATVPSAARAQLVDRLLLNLLLGNNDGHGKNFALLYTDAGIELAPAYDLLCTQVYSTLSSSFAMRVGPARQQEQLTLAAWQELANDVGIEPEQLRARGRELSAAAQAVLPLLPAQLLDDSPALRRDIYPARKRDDFLRRLADVIIGNCKRIARSLQGRA